MMNEFCGAKAIFLVSVLCTFCELMMGQFHFWKVSRANVSFESVKANSSM